MTTEGIEVRSVGNTKVILFVYFFLFIGEQMFRLPLPCRFWIDYQTINLSSYEQFWQPGNYIEACH